MFCFDFGCHFLFILFPKELTAGLFLSFSEAHKCAKDLGVMIASNLKFSHQCKDASGKGNRIQDFI